MHRPLFLATVGSAAAVGGLLIASAMPAGAATAVLDAQMQTGPCIVPTGSASGSACTPPATTPVTFTVTTVGTLSISAPLLSVNLGSAAVGGTVGAPANFGPVTVIDNRALDPAGWIATVACTDFTTGLGLAVDTIPVGDATYTVPDEASGVAGAIAAVPTPVTVPATPALPLPSSVGLTPTLTDNAAGGISLAIPSLTPPVGAAIVTVAGFDGDNGATWSPEISVAVPATAVAGIYTGTVTHSVT